MYKDKEKEYNDAMAQVNVINENLRVELDRIKTKYEKIIQTLTLKNNELNMRVKNLINTLIGLKDYALNIERNLNRASLNGNNINNYKYLQENYIQCNEVNNDNFNEQNDYQFNYEKLDEQNKNCRQMINNMKNIINQIDEYGC